MAVSYEEAMNLQEYERMIYSNTNIEFMRREAIERMRINLGIIEENTELRKQLRRCEEGKRA